MKRCVYSVDLVGIQFTFVSFVPMNCGLASRSDFLAQAKPGICKFKVTVRCQACVRENSKSKPKRLAVSCQWRGRLIKVAAQETNKVCVGCWLLPDHAASNREHQEEEAKPIYRGLWLLLPCYFCRSSRSVLLLLPPTDPSISSHPTTPKLHKSCFPMCIPCCKSLEKL